MSHARTFADIYARSAWYGGSGPGSRLENCRGYLIFLARYIRRHGITSVLDLGCGDGQLARAADWSGAAYTGIDVVDLGQDLVGDVLACPLPPAALVLVKDVLQHWPTADVQALLPRLAAFPRALITNSASGIRTNTDTAMGGFRSLDLAAPPFSWPVREVFRWHGDEIKAVVELRSPAVPIPPRPGPAAQE